MTATVAPDVAAATVLVALAFLAIGLALDAWSARWARRARRRRR